MPKRFYITTPIYYVNSVPHVGTTLTTVICDIIARYRKMRGDEVKFLTGTDENGLKIMEAAEKQGLAPQALVDKISQQFVEIFGAMNVAYDDFIRTTEPRHIRAAQEFFRVLKEKGHIYLGTYEGWYDVSTETFFKEADLVDGKSPDGNDVTWVSEENYFFRLSAFEQPLLDYIENTPGFLQPETRKNEVVSFIKQGLRDMCITRSNPGWGIPVPGDNSRVIYVWFDALINYIAGTGWPDAGYENIWPADVHYMAKEIFTRFHATLWPAMLMGMELPFPKTVIAHGWFNFGDTKMSKSKGNVIAPLELAAEIVEKSGCAHPQSVDAVRWSLATLLPYEGDTNFTREEVDKRYNVDLANDLGNALNRTLSMAHKFVGGVVPDVAPEPEAIEAIRQGKIAFEQAMQDFRIHQAADSALSVVRFLNKYIDTRAPWNLAKNNDPALPAVLRSMLQCLRATEALIRPIMPWTADALAEQLNHLPLAGWDGLDQTNTLLAGTKLGEPKPLFPRMEPPKPAPKPEKPAQPAKPKAPEPPAEIAIDDFMKITLRVGRVLEAEPIEGSDKLLKLQVMIGEEKRQIVAGIKANYTPVDLIGRQVIVLANLKPVTLRGVESQGMLLAATDENGGAILLQPDREAPEGTGVK